MSWLTALLVPFPLFALSACPGPSFRDASPAERPAWIEGDLVRALVDPTVAASSSVDARAFPRPELEVLPPDALGRDPVSVQVVGHFRAGLMYRLALRGADDRTFELRYRVANGLRLPLVSGDKVTLARWGDGLVARDLSGASPGAFRFVLAIDPPTTGDERLRLLADAVLPAFIPDRLAYAELGAAATGCVSSVDHHALEVRLPVIGLPDARAFLGPGRALQVRLTSETGEEGRAILLALDASRPTPRRAAATEASPRCGPPPHVSWLVVSTPATPNMPAESARP